MSPHSSVGHQLPDALWNNDQKPKLHSNHNFGQSCFVTIPIATRSSKLDPRGKKGRCLFYDPMRFGYHVMLEDSKIIVSRDVRLIHSQPEPHNHQPPDLTPQDIKIIPQPLLPLPDLYTPSSSSDESSQCESEETPDELINDSDQDQHCGLTRSNIINHKRISKKIFTATTSTIIPLTSPKTIHEIEQRPDSQSWHEAMAYEEESMLKNEVFTHDFDRSAIKHPISSRWVFKLKLLPDGTIARYRARLVARGYSQIPEQDFFETYSPVIRHETVRILFHVAGHKKLKTKHVDIETAFLIPKLNETLHLRFPNGRIVLLNKPIYGLKQGSIYWNQDVDNTMKEFNLTPSIADPCVYHLLDGKEELYVGVFVDDFLCFGTENLLHKFYAFIASKYPAKDLGEISFGLGMEIRSDPLAQTFSLTQGKYIREILEKFPPEKSLNTMTPYQYSLDLTTEDSPLLPDISIYRSMLGSLHHLCSLTRPDLIHITNQLSRYQCAPREVHMRAIKHVYQYLQSTKNYGIVLGGDSLLPSSYCDADFAGGGNLNTKSTSGYLFRLGLSPIHWLSRTQDFTAISTPEAELDAMTTAVKENLWFKQLLEDLKIIKPNSSITTYEDNLPCIDMITNRKASSRTKYLIVKQAFVKERIASKEVTVKFIPTTEQLADLFTKVQKGPHYRKLINNIQVMECGGVSESTL